MVAPVKPQKVGKQAKDDFVGAEDVATTFDLLANDGGGPNVSLFSVNQIDPFNVQISARTALGDYREDRQWSDGVRSDRLRVHPGHSRKVRQQRIVHLRNH